jgi:hypothetical protein
MPTKNSNSLSLTLFLLAILACCFHFIGCSSGAQAKKESAAIPSSAPSQTPDPGYDHWLNQKDNQIAYLAVSEETLSTLIMAEESDQPFAAIGQIYGRGTVFGVNINTPVEILENKGTCAKVRILDGPKKGKLGWIQTEFIKSKNSI